MLVNEIVLVVLIIFATMGLFGVIGFAIYLLNTWYSNDIQELTSQNRTLTANNKELRKDITDLVRENRNLKEQQK